LPDATAHYSDEMMHAALDYASALVTTKEVADSISSLLAFGGRAARQQCTRPLAAERA
jgi:hypothetical protein